MTVVTPSTDVDAFIFALARANAGGNDDLCEELEIVFGELLEEWVASAHAPAQAQ